MTLEQLRIFVAVAEREHVTQAAAFLNLTQSATSAAIAALEERHAVRLFDRVGRRIVLTDAGRLFLDEARAVLARAEQATRLLGDLAGMKRGKLRLAASQTIANYWLPPLMHRFHCDHPGIVLELAVGNTREVAEMVHAATVDLGIVEGEITDRALTIHSLPGDRLALVVAPGHDWARHPPSGPGRAEIQPLGNARGRVRHPGGLRSRPCRSRLDAGDVEIAFELPSNEAVRVAVESGAGAAILSNLVVAPAIDAGRLVQVHYDLPPRRFHVLRHRERHLSLAEKGFLDLV